jgi:hypothetical protein
MQFDDLVEKEFHLHFTLNKICAQNICTLRARKQVVKFHGKIIKANLPEANFNVTCRPTFYVFALFNFY